MRQKVALRRRAIDRGSSQVETPTADTTKTEASGNDDTTRGTQEAKSLERGTSEGEGQVSVNLARARVGS